MPPVEFDQVVEQIQALSLVQQQRLRKLLDSWLASPPAPLTEQEFAEEMARRGILSVPPPVTDFTPYQNRRLGEVRGKPVSETIIEERR